MTEYILTEVTYISISCVHLALSNYSPPPFPHIKFHFCCIKNTTDRTRNNQDLALNILGKDTITNYTAETQLRRLLELITSITVKHD